MIVPFETVSSIALLYVDDLPLWSKLALKVAGFSLDLASLWPFNLAPFSGLDEDGVGGRRAPTRHLYVGFGA